MIVVGSVNVDRVLRCPTLPRPGETVLTTTTNVGYGGKGGNQAAAAARLGADTWLIAAVGADADGAAAVSDLRGCGVHVEGVYTVPDAVTGQATVLVDDRGENAIVVAPGANRSLTFGHVSAALRALALDATDVVLVSAEVGERCVEAAARLCAEVRAQMVYNLAPARPLGAWDSTAPVVLVVNEVEAAQVAGARDPEEAIGWLQRRLVPTVVTRGARGALIVTPDGVWTVPAASAHVVDTTGAGDAFCGALAADLASGADLLAALHTAVAAAAVAVSAPGARGALARRKDLTS
ncbi:PfkB family carbohydrate kinase [Micromonospora sp. 4G55]|uniref:PfkB family carbohydrate kinase n=1 Tax=Micromonospora sp. 4G55 TaxID=2806102 RepID=UPI001A49218A|nr:PfkB family carbohydrate kinase [Micromonospora sp. 4G55]MBM0258764.1 ribokinase [Micromonospora sp. 4G55]